jgi:hypothetical protein
MFEWWYVRMAIPEDGVGGLLGEAGRLDVRVAASSFGSVESIDLVFCGRQGYP